MKQTTKVAVLSGIIAILANLPINAAGFPCAAEYKEYRKKLITEKWIPVAVANNVKGFTEVVSGTRLASATWLDPSRKKTWILVLWWEKMKLCVPPYIAPD